MKKVKLRALLKLREMSEKVLGKEETDRIIDETVKEVLEETKPKRVRKTKGDK